MRIDIYSDVVCPWCWIGKHRFQQGVQLLGANAPELDIHWQPFQLDPDADATPVPLREAYVRKFGGVERTEQILGQTQTTARAEGLPMDFSQGQVRVTTLPAHRVLWLAGEHGVQDAVGEALFRAHFEHGQNLADPSVLIKAGVTGGLDAGEIAQMLAAWPRSKPSWRRPMHWAFLRCRPSSLMGSGPFPGHSRRRPSPTPCARLRPNKALRQLRLTATRPAARTVARSDRPPKKGTEGIKTYPAHLGRLRLDPLRPLFLTTAPVGRFCDNAALRHAGARCGDRPCC